MHNLALFAQTGHWSDSDAAHYGAVLIGIVVLAFGSIALLLMQRYKRCPSNRVLVIYGKYTGSPTGTRCIHGGAAFVLPLVQDYAFLAWSRSRSKSRSRAPCRWRTSASTCPASSPWPSAPTRRRCSNAAIRICCGLSTRGHQAAGERHHLRPAAAGDRLDAASRTSTATATSSCTTFRRSLEPELQKIGLVLINVNITDITDESGYIEAIGRKAASQAVQQAKVDVAQQEKHGQIGVAEAEREKSIQVANATKLREIGTREADARTGGPAGPAGKGAEGRRADRGPGARGAGQGIAAAAGGAHRPARQGAEGRRANRRPSSGRRRSRTPSARCVSPWPTPTPRRSPARATAQAEIAAAQANLQVKQAEAYQLGETQQTRGRGRGAGGAEPGDGQGRPGPGRARRGREASGAGSPGQGREGQDHRRGRGRGRETPHRGGRPGGRHLRQARGRGPRPVRNPGQEGRGSASASSKRAAAHSRRSSS